MADFFSLTGSIWLTQIAIVFSSMTGVATITIGAMWTFFLLPDVPKSVVLVRISSL